MPNACTGRENALEAMRILAEAARNVDQAMKVLVDAVRVFLEAVEGFMSFTLCRLLKVQAVNVLVEPLDCFRGHENLVEAVSDYGSPGREKIILEALRFLIEAMNLILEVYRTTAQAKKFR
jgi:hypothetical protein